MYYVNVSFIKSNNVKNSFKEIITCIYFFMLFPIYAFWNQDLKKILVTCCLYDI